MLSKVKLEVYIQLQQKKNISQMLVAKWQHWHIYVIKNFYIGYISKYINNIKDIFIHVFYVSAWKNKIIKHVVSNKFLTKILFINYLIDYNPTLKLLK